MKTFFFTFLVFFLSGCSVLKTEQARTDDASSRSTSGFLDKLRSFHGNTLAIACYKGPNLPRLVYQESKIRLPGIGSTIINLGKIYDKRKVLAGVTMAMGPTGNFTGPRFRKYSGMVDKMVYLQEIDENSAFYAYEVPDPEFPRLTNPRIAILKLINRGIAIIKVKEDEWSDIPSMYKILKEYRLENGILREDGKLTGWNDVIVNSMLRDSRDHLIAQMNKLDPNADPDWILLLKANYYQAMFNDNDLPKYVTFYSNF